MGKRESNQRVEPVIPAHEQRKKELRDQGLSASQAGREASREAANRQAKGGES